MNILGISAVFGLAVGFDVTVNNNKPVLFTQEDTEQSEVKLSCSFRLKNQAEYKRKCDADKRDCARITWIVQNSHENPDGSEDIIARRTNTEYYVRNDFSSRYQILEPTHLTLLHPIKHINVNGTYTCRVEIDSENPALSEASFGLLVRVPVTNVQIIGEEDPVLNKPTTLTCLAEGQEPPTFKWFFDDMEIEHQRSPNSELSEDLHTSFTIDPANTGKLVINSVQKQHDGKYTCSASNAASEDGVMTNSPFYLTAAAIDKTLFMYIAAGAGLLLVAVVLIIYCCCCRNSGKNKKSQPNPLHHMEYDPVVGENVQYTAGRSQVHAARSQPYYEEPQSQAYSQGYNDEATMVKPGLDSTYQSDYRPSNMSMDKLHNQYDGY